MPDRVIFEIDNDHDPHVVAKFYRQVDTARAMGLMSPMRQLIGCYKGQMARSYMIRLDELRHVRAYIAGQESLLVLPEDPEENAWLVFVTGGRQLELGPRRVVSPAEALQAEAWTYDPDADEYFIC